MTPLLSVLICSLESRAQKLSALLDSIRRQAAQIEGPTGAGDELIEVLTEVDAGELPIGAKRNILMGRARGTYVCYVDDDDTLADTYCRSLVEACRQGKDCVGITGEISIRAARRPHVKRFVMSLRYKQYHTGKRAYERTPNHLCPVKRSIAVKFPFDDLNEGEDSAYASAMASARALKTEAFVEEPIYFYEPSGQGRSRRDWDNAAKSATTSYVKAWLNKGSPAPMPHELKQEAILHYKRKSGAQQFIETGTYHGDTAFNMTKHFRHVHTIEASKLLFDKLVPPHRQWPKNITCHFGKSYELLGGIVRGLEQGPENKGRKGKKREGIVFWLDAHGSQWGKEAVEQPKRPPRPKQGAMPSGPGAIDVPDCSLLNELEVLYPLLRTGDVILIDDANIFGTYGWPPVCSVYAHAHAGDGVSRDGVSRDGVSRGFRVRREALLMVIEV